MPRHIKTFCAPTTATLPHFISTYLPSLQLTLSRFTLSHYTTFHYIELQNTVQRVSILSDREKAVIRRLLLLKIFRGWISGVRLQGVRYHNAHVVISRYEEDEIWCGVLCDVRGGMGGGGVRSGDIDKLCAGREGEGRRERRGGGKGREGREGRKEAGEGRKEGGRG